MFTTWIAGETTNTVTVTLPFDPADGLHDRRIEWSPGEVRFTVDGVVMQEWREGIPRSLMLVMANTWWQSGSPDLRSRRHGRSSSRGSRACRTRKLRVEVVGSHFG